MGLLYQVLSRHCIALSCLLVFLGVGEASHINTNVVAWLDPFRNIGVGMGQGEAGLEAAGTLLVCPCQDVCH